MFNIIKQVIKYQDVLYVIKRILKESSIKEEFVQEYKEFLAADIVLKKDGMYYFANKIDEVEALPEEEQIEQEV